MGSEEFIELCRKHVTEYVTDHVDATDVSCFD